MDTVDETEDVLDVLDVLDPMDGVRGFLNRAPRFESWRGRVCAGQSVARVTREARKHRCAKPMQLVIIFFCIDRVLDWVVRNPAISLSAGAGAIFLVLRSALAAYYGAFGVYLQGREELRAAMDGAWTLMRPIKMVTRSLAVEADAMYYEFAVVWEVRSSGERVLFTGMTYHQVDPRGRLVLCREYFDPPGRTRRTAADSPELAPLLNARQ